MSGPAIKNPTPPWLLPENASVFDPAWMRVARRLAPWIGADDPQSQVLALANPMEIGGGPTGSLMELAGKAVRKVREVPGSLKDVAKKGIRAFHGSPHDFDQFSLSKIGTGEGAQAYGHGLYFAENEGVAKQYRDNFQSFKDAKVKTDAGEVLNVPTWVQARMDEGRVDSVIEDFTGRLKEIHDKKATILQPWLVDDQIQNTERILKAAHAFKSGQAKTAPAAHMYEVNINADPDDFLDWDAPLSQQSEKVRQALTAMGVPAGDASGQFTVKPTDSGKSFKVVSSAGEFGTYRTEAAAQKRMDQLIGAYSDQGATAYQKLGGNTIYPGAGKNEAATQALRDAGILGIKYLDGASRSAGQGSRNYVVFDERLISIVKKYGIAGALSAGFLNDAQARAMQEQGYQ